jgi:hypothetical protein
MEKCMTSCHFEHDPSDDTAFYEAIKEAEKTPNNEGQMVQGVNPAQEPDKDRGTGLDAPWGAPPPPALALSKEVAAETRKNREALLSRLIGSKPASDAAQQAIVAGQLAHGASGDFRTHSTQLKAKDKVASAETLLEMTRRICGRP